MMRIRISDRRLVDSMAVFSRIHASACRDTFPRELLDRAQRRRKDPTHGRLDVSLATHVIVARSTSSPHRASYRLIPSGPCFSILSGPEGRPDAPLGNDAANSIRAAHVQTQRAHRTVHKLPNSRPKISLSCVFCLGLHVRTLVVALQGREPRTSWRQRPCDLCGRRHSISLLRIRRGAKDSREGPGGVLSWVPFRRFRLTCGASQVLLGVRGAAARVCMHKMRCLKWSSADALALSSLTRDGLGIRTSFGIRSMRCDPLACTSHRSAGATLLLMTVRLWRVGLRGNVYRHLFAAACTRLARPPSLGARQRAQQRAVWGAS